MGLLHYKYHVRPFNKIPANHCIGIGIRTCSDGVDAFILGENFLASGAAFFYRD